MARKINYGSIIKRVFQDSTGGGHRQEAAARVAHALLYSEAVAARSEAQESGFVVVLESQFESFTLRGPKFGPHISFLRQGTYLKMQAAGFGKAARGTFVDQEWLPGSSPEEEIQTTLETWIALAVELLARSVQP
jgi:hypothetical protein